MERFGFTAEHVVERARTLLNRRAGRPGRAGTDGTDGKDRTDGADGKASDRTAGVPR
jgi:hypothetical protein